MSNDHHRLRVLQAEEPEFAEGVDEPPSEIDRRELLKFLGAGAALATGVLGGCMKEPTERIMPRIEQPPELVPGVPREYATAIRYDRLTSIGRVGRRWCLEIGRMTYADCVRRARVNLYLARRLNRHSISKVNET